MSILFLYKKYYREVLVLLAVLSLVVGPWVLRNYLRHGILFTNATGGFELWVSILPESGGEFYPSEEAAGYLEEHGLFETAEYGKEQFKNFVLEHPAAFAERQIEKTLTYFSAGRTSAFWLYLSELKFRRAAVLLSSAFFNLALLAFGLAGLYLAFKEKKLLYDVFLLLAVSVPLSVIPVVVTGRYRYPLLAFLSVGAIYLLRLIFKQKFIPPVFWYCFFLLLSVTAIDLVWHSSRFLSHLKTLGVF